LKNVVGLKTARCDSSNNNNNNNGGNNKKINSKVTAMANKFVVIPSTPFGVALKSV